MAIINMPLENLAKQCSGLIQSRAVLHACDSSDSEDMRFNTTESVLQILLVLQYYAIFVGEFRRTHLTK